MICVLVAAVGVAGAFSQTQPPAHPGGLLIVVTDENEVVVPLASVTLENIGSRAIVRGQTDSTGRLFLRSLPAGTYHVHIEKTGFYALDNPALTLGASDTLQIAIHHQQEVGEDITVLDSVSGIDPQQTAKSEALNSREITNIPYPSTRDIRNVLTFIPGVLQDNFGNIHVAGAPSSESLNLIDGFNINEPASGTFQMRISPEAVRRIEVQSTRYSVEFPDTIGGVISLDTRTGDDHYRVSAVNFIPTLQTTRGINLNNWTPRVTFGGPIVHRRAWFYVAHESEYDLTIVKQLPAGQDRNWLWRTSDLGKVQINLSPGNVLSLEFLGNLLNTPRFGLDAFDPISITRKESNTAYMFGVHDQITVSRNGLLELGGAFIQFNALERPQGTAPEILQPGSNSGNFYRRSHSRTRRGELFGNLYLPPVRNWLGRHDFRAGVDAEEEFYSQSYRRSPVTSLRTDGSLSRITTFTPLVSFNRNNFETGGYFLDHWSIGNRLALEPGVRVDWDEIFREPLVSPRFAGAFMLTGDTKLTFGAGWFYNSINLEPISRPLSGIRTDQFFNPDGTPTGPPVTTTFAANLHTLHQPDALNWSVGVQQKLPHGILGSVEFLQRLGQHDFAYNNPAAASGVAGGVFQLNDNRQNRYTAVQLNAKKDFANHHGILASYTHSRATTNEVLGFSVDSLVFGRQLGGPLSWDAPNRFISWGFLPIPKFFKWDFPKWDFAYSAEWRSGFPFSLFNDQQELVGLPNRSRFPDLLTINPALERRFNFHGYLWALRVGIDNVTDHNNPSFVDNNINSPTFLEFGGSRGRTFNGRIRFLGKEAKK
jgi:hypothetical protein